MSRQGVEIAPIPAGPWRCRDLALDTASCPLVMGIVNVTPDSFSDGGMYASTAAALRHARRLLREGADILDIGGESTRPGANPVSADEECSRVIPVISELAKDAGAVISIDTAKAAVAKAALEAGAHIVNDVSALTGDVDMFEIVQRSGSGVVLMHMAGTPRTMQLDPVYEDVVAEIFRYLAERVDCCVAGGIARNRLCIDPGIGFGKTLEHNLALLRHIDVLLKIGVRVLVGLSRKRFLGEITGRPTEQRLAAGLAALSLCVDRGVDVLRVHDVEAARDAVRVARALRRPPIGEDL